MALTTYVPAQEQDRERKKILRALELQLEIGNKRLSCKNQSHHLMAPDETAGLGWRYGETLKRDETRI